MKKKSGFLKGLLVCIGAALGLVVVKLMLLSLTVGGVFLLLFSACSEHPNPHSRREAAAYLQEAYPGEEIVVSKRWTSNVSKYGSEDGGRVWDCYYKDMPDVTFQVISFRRTGGPIPVWGYDITDNASRSFWEYYVEQYQTTAGRLDAWTDDYRLKMEFSAMEEVYPAAEQLQAFCDWYKAKPHAPEFPSPECILADMALGIRPLENRFVYLEPTEGKTMADCMIESCAALLKDFYTFYDIPSLDFTAEELESYAAARWKDAQGILTQSDGERVPNVIMDGIGLMPNGGSALPYTVISYGGLYELLTRLGCEPDGSPSYYTVAGMDGSLYEFSYDPVEIANGTPCCPVRRDGRQLPCKHLDRVDCPPVLSLRSEIFQAVTGLTAAAE
ncbi:MAG: hypothetical protein HFF84_00800 [Oscillibacter sp.]|nr:hypothetical protein [Oscillibacter sp.]